jgi:ABC-type multidrug transport system ATPase subunit
MPALTARGVRKRYTRRGPWVLDGVDLTIEPGTTTLVHGGNGSGKSTLLRVAAGVIDPTGGRVERTVRTAAYVPERAPVQIRMTAARYVEHMGRIRGLDTPTCSARAAELFGRLDLQPGPDVAVSTLSKGNRQKVLLTQAFLDPVELLALDEPFAGLDPAAHSTLVELIAGARAGGTAVLVTGHAPSAFPGADRVLRIVGGTLQPEDAVGTGSGTPGGPTPRAGVRIELARAAGAVAPSAVVIEPGASDDLLARALAAGWSVTRVERETRS